MSPSQCVMILADALFNVWHKALLLKIANQQIEKSARHATPERLAEWFDAEEAAASELYKSIASAHAAIPGVDVWVRKLAGTNPGEWTSRVKELLITVESSVKFAGGASPHDEQGEILRQQINEIYQRQYWLRTRDLSAVAQVPSFETVYKFDYAYQVELIRATNQVLGEGELNAGALSRACKSGKIATNGQTGRRALASVESFLIWIARKHDLQLDEHNQIRNAVIGEIRARKS